jgi:hypothetical protein
MKWQISSEEACKILACSIPSAVRYTSPIPLPRNATQNSSSGGIGQTSKIQNTEYKIEEYGNRFLSGEMPEWHVGELSERDENSLFLNQVYSEFLPLECFCYFLHKK